MGSFGIVGFGRIGRRIADRLAASPPAPDLVAYLVRPSQAHEARSAYGAERVVTDAEAFIARRPAVAVEAASASTLAALGPGLLAAGIDLVPLSLAALADRDVEARLMAAAAAGPGRLEIPAGAVASLGFLAAAREDALSSVVVRAAYPVARLRGTRAESMADLASLDWRQVIFSGSVRDLATDFPQRVNVTVAVALAGLGLDRTRAELIADPALNQAEFEIATKAGPGDITLRVGPRDVPAGADPVDYTAFSVMRLLRRRVAPVLI